jgi:hypothetical protein
MRKFLIIGGVVMLVAILACVGEARYATTRRDIRPRRIPDGEIVFRPTETYNSFGFIDPEGSNYTTRETVVTTSFVTGYHLSGPNSWSLDGTYMTTNLMPSIPFSAFPIGYSGVPAIATSDGKVYYCEDLFSEGRVWGLNNNRVVANVKNQVVILNMETCRIENVLYHGVIADMAYSSTGWLAIHDGSSIIVLDDQQQQVFTRPGSMPAWSKDGQWLAYVTVGIYITDRSGNDSHLILRQGDNPSWSPDGEQIVYDWDEDLYIGDIGTGESSFLYSGGANPDWR